MTITYKEVKGNKMRKYAPIWNQIKKDSHCSITAHKAFHPRIIKAVIGEKYRDIGYKIICDSQSRKAVLHHDVTGSRVRFFLIYYDDFSLGDF